jgi:hypothetical protein
MFIDARVTPATASRSAAFKLKGRNPPKRTILIDVHGKLDYALSKWVSVAPRSSIVASESVTRIFNAKLDTELLVAKVRMLPTYRCPFAGWDLIHVNSLSPSGRKKREALV